MYRICINTWYNCVPNDVSGNIELCKICRPAGYSSGWQIVTYYDAKEVFSGELKACLRWLEEHITDRRYLDNASPKL